MCIPIVCQKQSGVEVYGAQLKLKWLNYEWVGLICPIRLKNSSSVCAVQYLPKGLFTIYCIQFLLYRVFQETMRLYMSRKTYFTYSQHLSLL